MDSLRLVLQTVIKGLKLITKEVEKFEEQLSKVEEKKRVCETIDASPRKRRGRPPRTGRPSATATVLELIECSKKGISTAKIKEKTGFDEKKIWNIINRLKKEGKVKNIKRGLYGKA